MIHLFSIRSDIKFILIPTGALCCLCSVVAFFVIPETKGRTLEEIDQLFENHVKAWSFSRAETSWAARRTAQIQHGEEIMEDMEMGKKGDEMLLEDTAEGEKKV